MKKIIHKKINNFKKLKKTMLIRTRAVEDDSVTTVEKGFIYRVSRTHQMSSEPSQPQIKIRKSFDTRRRIENFTMDVRGHFFITHNRILRKVYFRHKLNICIQWKQQAFSPKKSAVLTE